MVVSFARHIDLTPREGQPRASSAERVAASVDTAVEDELGCAAVGYRCPCPLNLNVCGHGVDPYAGPANVESEGAGASPAHRVWSDRLAGLGALTY